MRSVVHWLVGTFVLALVLRTWFMLGLVEPVIVAGDSMLPALAAGQPLVIDRRDEAPSRWTSVVFVNSADSGSLAVKRVVGLPGETIELRQGDVWCDGELLIKPPNVQRRTKVLVHREGRPDLRWNPSNDSRWHWSAGGWHVDAAPGEAAQWLDYQHPQGEAITDDLEENAGTVRQLFPVRDFFLCARLQVSRGGELALRVRGGPTEVKTAVELRPGAALVEFSNFDRHAWLAVDGRTVWEQPLPDQKLVVGTASPFSLGARGCELSAQELTVYRDIYYLSAEEEAGYRENLPFYRVGPGELLVLGDNGAVSQDSRHWGPLPLKYLVGRVIFPR